MEFILFVNIYVDSMPQRLKELLSCFMLNCKNPEIDRIIAIYSTDNEYDVYSQISKHVTPQEFAKVVFAKVENRPTYNNYFAIMKPYSGIKALTNADILFTPAQTKKIKSIRWQDTRNICISLSVWDLYNDAKILNLDAAVLRDRVDSQDTWIFYDVPAYINEADFTLGIAGCDNKIAYLLLTSGYRLFNPCKDIKTYHYHLTEVRHYLGKNVQRVDPPYHVFPTEYLKNSY